MTRNPVTFTLGWGFGLAFFLATIHYAHVTWVHPYQWEQIEMKGPGE